MQIKSVLGCAVWQPQVVVHGWVIADTGSLALNRQHKVIQRLFAPALGTLCLQGNPSWPGSAQPCCLCWASVPTGCALLLWWPLQASTDWNGLEHSLQDWLERERMVSRKWYWLCGELKLCYFIRNAFPFEILKCSLSCMMEAFAFENSCAFLSTVQASVPQLIFHPHTVCPLAKDCGFKVTVLILLA